LGTAGRTNPPLALCSACSEEPLPLRVGDLVLEILPLVGRKDRLRQLLAVDGQDGVDGTDDAGVLRVVLLDVSAHLQAGHEPVEVGLVGLRGAEVPLTPWRPELARMAVVELEVEAVEGLAVEGVRPSLAICLAGVVGVVDVLVVDGGKALDERHQRLLLLFGEFRPRRNLDLLRLVGQSDDLQVLRFFGRHCLPPSGGFSVEGQSTQ
jgi:hypothetical protein